MRDNHAFQRAVVRRHRRDAVMDHPEWSHYHIAATGDLRYYLIPEDSSLKLRYWKFLRARERDRGAPFILPRPNHKATAASFLTVEL